MMQMEIDDQGRRFTSTTTTVGFNLLPTDLIHSIFFQLALPEIPRLGSVSKAFKSVTSDSSFLHHYNSKFQDTPWLFIYTKKRWGQDAVLKGITTGFDQWFNFSIKEWVAPFVHRSNDLYFLTACGNFFLFAINTSKEIVSVNLMTKSVKKIPPSPLGPRDTSSWRRSGMKLVLRPGGSNHFRFFFVEKVLQNKMYLFEYDSLIEKWKSTDVQEYETTSFYLNSDESKQNGFIFLAMLSGQGDHITLAIGLDKDMPLRIISPLSIHYPLRTEDDQDLMIGFDESSSEWMRIYGDGTMLKLKSFNLSERKKITVRMELWACSKWNGSQWRWEMISTVPKELMMSNVKNPYGVMRGCLERINGVVRTLLMSNYEGSWEFLWLSYEMEKKQWTCTLLPDCNMKEANMGGIGFSSGLTLPSLSTSRNLI